MQKKTFDLICSVGELTGIFHKKTNINGLLDIVVKLVARHMQTEACSIFLLNDDNSRLVLRATKGLNPEMVGRLKLAPGEGITGTCLATSKPILVPRGSEDSNFKYVEGIFEETYESFLAVPILHSQHRLGVIILEDSKPDYYNDRDTRALSTIASQLATFLENAKLLLELRRKGGASRVESGDSDEPKLKLKEFYRGEAASPGIALGNAVVVSGKGGHLLMMVDPGLYRTGLKDFEIALEKTKLQLQALQQHMEDALSEVGSLIFGSHLLMLSDEEFSGSMRKLIQSGLAPAKAIEQVVNEYVTLFINSKNVNIQEKVHDVRDLGHRLLKNLLTRDSEDGDYTGQIVVARNLLPSELVKLGVQNTEGFVLYGGGVTGHLSILARSLEVPVIFLPDEEFFQGINNRYIVIDAYQGTVMIDPAREVEEHYRDLIAHREGESEEESESMPFQAIPLSDGTRLELMANINILSDIHSAKRFGATAVGLYRSEFLFLIRNDFPTEEEQRFIYEKLLDQIETVTFRTFDLGGDKTLRTISHREEKNPFLGLRSLRYAMEHRELFITQLRAILRACTGRTARILFPLVAGVDDFLEAKELVLQTRKELDREKLPQSEDVLIGAMIELPSAALLSEEIGREADFLSIGTNDLVQYVLGIDRTNESVAHLFDHNHPGVQKMILQIVRGAEKAACPVSVCGNSAADPQMLRFFVHAGIRSFSVDPRSFHRVKMVLQEIGEAYGTSKRDTSDPQLPAKKRKGK